MIIDSPVISGSLANSGSFGQVGDVSITGSLTVTGNINGNITGSAASASQAVSASYSLSSSYALSSSYGLSGSYAATASSADSFLVRGTLTAQTIVVQTITSSVDFVTGSTHFGSIVSNTHEFTGSVGISGSLAVNNSAVISTAQTSSMSVLSASYAATASYWSGSIASASYAANANTSSYALTASYAANVPVTAAYADNANSASYAANATSASYALTASYWSGSIQSASYALTASYALNAGAGAGFPYSGSAVITGSLLITNLTSSGTSYLVADANGNITAQSASAALKTTQPFTATAGQTVFAVSGGYVTGYVDVFINGSKLSNAEFVDTSGTNIVLATGSFVNDVVEVVKYMPAAGVSTNVLRQLTTFTATAAQTVFTVDYTPGLLDIYYNGARLSSVDYTAANGTSITLATASAAGDVLDVMVYSYQVGAMSGIGGNGVAGQIAYYNTTNSITGSPNFSIVGSTINVTGSMIVSSSSTFTNIGPAIFSGSVTSTTGFTGSFSGSMSGTATSASAAISSSYATSASVAISSSYALSSSYSVSSSAAVSSSYATSASAAVSSSYATSASVAVSAANSTLFENTASVRFATTASNNFTAPQHVTDLTVPTGFANTSGSIYTDGGLLVNKDAYFSSSMFIKGNLTIYGTQSIAYITSSQLNIATNLITVNTATPSVRFGGLAVYDSGSTGTGMTGSLLWDSQNNSWIYDNPSGSGNYDSSMVIMGPRNASALGSEQGLNCNYLIQGHGHHHTTSSMIFHDGTNTCIPNNLIGSTICSTMTNASCIGIGTVTPASYTLLDVNGQTIFRGNPIITSGNALKLNQYYNSGTGTDKAVATGYAGQIYFDTTSGYISFQNSSTSVSANADISVTERMRITNTGIVGVGVNPSAWCTVKAVQISAASIAGYSNTGYFNANSYYNTTTGWTYINSSYAARYELNSSDSGIHIFYSAASGTAGASICFCESMRISSLGNVGIGNNSPSNILDIAKAAQDTMVILTESSDNGDCTALFYARRSRGTSLTSPTAIQSGNNIGGIAMGAHDGSSYKMGAKIYGAAAENWSVGCNGTDIVFLTNSTTKCLPTEKVRINASGLVNFVCNVCVNNNLSVINGSNSLYAWSACAVSQPGLYAQICVGSAYAGVYNKMYGPSVNAGLFGYSTECMGFVGTDGACNRGLLFGTANIAPIMIGTSNTQRLYIASTGESNFTCQICVKETVYVYGSFPGVKLDRTTTTAQSDINWKDNGTSVWSIGTSVQAVGSNLDFYNYSLGGNVLKLTTTGEACFKYATCSPMSIIGCLGVNSTCFHNSGVRVAICGANAYDGVTRIMNTCNQGDANHGSLMIVNIGGNSCAGDDASIGFATMYQSYPHPRVSIGAKSEGSTYGAFHISTRGSSAYTERVRVNSDGQVTMAYQPSFMAYGNTSYGGSSSYLIYPTTQYNRGGHYNTATGVFTAPVSGIYYFSWSSIGNNTATIYRFWIRINNSTLLSDYHLRLDQGAITGAAYASNANRDVLVQLAAGDTVRIYYAADNASTAPYGNNGPTDTYLNFMGHLMA